MAYTSDAKMSINTGLDQIYSVHDSTPGKIETKEILSFDSPPLSVGDPMEAITEEQISL